RLASTVDPASEGIPAVRRYFLMVRGFLTLERFPRPWSALRDLEQALRLAREVADHKTELLVQVTATEFGWLEVGDLDGARRRMLALGERSSRNQEVLMSAVWAYHRAWILCRAPDEQAWDQAETLMAPLLSAPGGMLFLPLGAQTILARVALLRGRLAQAEE